MSPDNALTAEQILSATEDVLRRFGPAKATVVDVARTLGVSHGSVYRFFPSKAALREAVTERWLDQAHDELRLITDETGPAADRLHRWLATLFAAKRRKALDDPQLFATYMTLVGENSSTVETHIGTLIAQIADIVRDGVESGEFQSASTDPTAHVGSTARAVFEATAHFHNPAHAASWSDPAAGERFEALWRLILGGLATRA
ncbi:TetR/AcrR family transcriptional regulator [Kitasatospora purpeofusca]|uniref:TetR/AcrR family transcriptional regulator n=1 Tax=Kitasatospora purpeofusca TaxID=67352 RepID=UPI0022511DDE|nr:TetR family transcriptional regulator [Kitasatospora purpeofusca]MCX4756829.1 TetR family transcriptional regulator [Kitasatospora purpeofusca]WSR35393.1 TetR family transcriptional regulator [Kitasatospora purpeofusca]